MISSKLNDEIVEIPEEYYQEAKHKGQMVRFDYKTQTYMENSEPMDKYAYVYVPYGYDPNKKYDVIYYIHGTGASAEKYLVTGGEENVLKRGIDNLIEKGDMESVLIVAPSWYNYNETHTNKPDAKELKENGKLIEKFHYELVNDLIPAVEQKYSTYAESFDREGLKASRNHRAVCGFSAGGRNTWNMFIYEMDIFEFFGPMSGSYKVNQEPNDKGLSLDMLMKIDFDVKATAASLYDYVIKQGYGKNDFRLVNYTGSNDAQAPMEAVANELANYSNIFDYSENGNSVFKVWEGGVHSSPCRVRYTLNMLPKIFVK